MKRVRGTERGIESERWLEDRKKEGKSKEREDRTE